jgi:hypothetical protein
LLFRYLARLASGRAIRSHGIRCLTPAPGESTIVLALIPTGGGVSYPDESAARSVIHL